MKGGMEPTPATLGMRRSCSECGRKKRKCDGLMPCRRCVDSGSRCVYEKRRCHLPRAHHEQRQRRRLGHDGVPPGGATKQSAPAVAASACEMLALKRCKFKASPATGLVGMPENTFLGDFFACVGFVPLTTQSHIRETMVKMMVTSTPSQKSAFGRDCDEDDVLAKEGDIRILSAENQLDAGPSTCTFWCAVALGALVKGGGVASVSGELPTGHFQWGYAEVVSHRMTVRMFSGNASTAEVESFCRQPQDPPQASEQEECTALKACCPSISSFSSLAAQLRTAASETELYAFMMQAYRQFEQAVYRTAYLESSDAGGLPSENEAGIRTACSCRVREASMAVVDTMASRINNHSCDFERLEDAADRPLIRQGIGGLIINGTLVFEKAAKGDFSGAVERIDRCVEVFETFPGVCRFFMGSHVAHIMVTALAAIGNSRTRGMYDRLRRAYNSTRFPDSSPIPPFEEWQGVSSFCDTFYCRTMELLIVGDEMGGMFAAGQNARADHQNEGDEGEEKEKVGHDQGAFWGIVDNDIPVGPFLLSAGGGGAEFDLLRSTRNARMGSFPADCAGAKCGPSAVVPRPIAGAPGWAQEVRSAYPLKSTREPETGRGAHLEVESDTGMAYGRSNDAGAVTQTSESMLGNGENVVEETEEDAIAAADWLDVSHALLVETELRASGQSRVR
ncbi:unnamed protein product [Ectocarpus sp. CCAP 1310/34]|nr:unnamed protein product [Ectocarpus sp. CCAP 1310/34]